MTKDSFFVLHLSDLHIQKATNRKPYYQASLKKLLNDIEKQTKDIQNIIIVVSGDIIDIGNYDDASVAVVCFFEDLYKKIQCKTRDIIIVPGNHDKKREPIDTLVSQSHSDFGIKIDSDVEWEFHLNAYKDFLELTNQIYRIFGKEYNAENTFGIEMVSIENTNVCFLKMDTAWCSHSHSKCRDLRIGEYQIKKLFNEYSELKVQQEDVGAPIDITIAISHYPLEWMNPVDSDLCNQYFLSEAFLNVDIVMCGHVHDFSVRNYFNHQHSLLTLVTGIGWNKEKPNDDKSSHRYSLYSISPQYNSCDITTRKTKENEEFDYDYSLYIGKQELTDNKIRFPLKIKENTPFLRINTADLISPNSLFLNNTIVSLIPRVSNVLASFSDRMAQLYINYKDNCYSGFLEKFIPEELEGQELSPDQETLKSKMLDYLYDDGELDTHFKNTYLNYETSFDDFLAFLTEICTCAVEEFKEYFTTDVILRAHFRWHVHKEKNGRTTVDEYSMLCQYRSDEEESEKDMQTLPWGSLLKPAFDTMEPIVYSANEGYNMISTSWDDFITLVPPFLNYKHDIRIRKGVNESRPVITFGFSIKGTSKEQELLFLHLLAYLRIDKTIAAMIDTYIQWFNIDTRTFLSEINRIKNKPAEEANNNE